jgi:acid stress chaperone HdeB
MSGYFSASKDINMVDFRYIERNVKKITSYCKSHRSETLMTAVEKNAR